MDTEDILLWGIVGVAVTSVVVAGVKAYTTYKMIDGVMTTMNQYNATPELKPEVKQSTKGEEYPECLRKAFRKYL